jgi:multicomponent Na+:H+ antiporter subunit D
MYHLFVLAPLLTAILLNLPFRRFMKKAALPVAATLFVLQIYAVIFPIAGIKFTALTDFFRFHLAADVLSKVLLLSSALVLLAALFTGRHFFRHEGKLFNFISLLLIVATGINGIALVRDIFSLYVFIEITGVTSFILITLDKERYALEAVFNYIILSAIATTMMLFSIALLLLVAGDTSFTAINAALTHGPQTLMINFAVLMFVAALFIKGGLVPFHGWLPDAYSAAPAGVSLLLAGVVTKALGIYGLVRVVTSIFGYNFVLNQIFLMVGTVSILFGAFTALGQVSFKRMLAYSSISQVGYIIVGLGCGSALGIFGAIFHLFNHSIFKSTLFVNSAAVELKTGTRSMDKMGGLAQQMPITGVTSIVSSLSAAGVPPLAGFWSKLLIVVALWSSGHYAYAAIAVVAGVVTLAYFLMVQRKIFFGKLNEEYAGVKEAGWDLTLPAIILTAITIGVGIIFPFLPGIPKL